jgi:hypothetical protein
VLLQTRPVDTNGSQKGMHYNQKSAIDEDAIENEQKRNLRTDNSEKEKKSKITHKS